jgi:CBS domain-containing protein
MTEPAAVGAEAVSELADEAVVRVAPGSSLHEVADALAEANVGVVVVGDDRAVSGVVSERDIVRALAERRDPATTSAGDIAHTDLVWCDATATIAEVASEMMDRYVRHVLVEEDGRLVGIVSARDLLGAYATADDDLD